MVRDIKTKFHTHSLPPNGISIGSAVFFRAVTDRARVGIACI